MLCDRLFCGDCEEEVQRCLFTEPDLTFTRAREMAIVALRTKNLTREIRDISIQETADVCYIDKNDSRKIFDNALEALSFLISGYDYINYYSCELSNVALASRT